MNENSSSTSAHHGLTAEAISRRAYELWESEGRPESRDLHHWLRAEQELLAEQQKKTAGETQSPSSDSVGASPAESSRPAAIDTQPMPGTRGGSPVPPKGPPTKRGTPPVTQSSRSNQPGGRTDPLRSNQGRV